MQYILSTSNTNTYHTYVSSRTPPFRTLGQTPTSPQGGSSVFFGETPRYKDFAKATFADLMHHLSGTRGVVVVEWFGKKTGVKRRIFRSILPVLVMVSKNGGSDRGNSDPHSNQLETLQSKTLQENPVDLLYPPPSYSSQSTPPSVFGYFFWWLFLGRWFWFFLFGAALKNTMDLHYLPPKAPKIRTE